MYTRAKLQQVRGENLTLGKQKPTTECIRAPDLSVSQLLSASPKPLQTRYNHFLPFFVFKIRLGAVGVAQGLLLGIFASEGQ